MKLKYFLKLKEKDNENSWILFTRYILATVLYRLHREFRYMITNKNSKTEQSQITFYYNDILTYIKKHNSILNLQNNCKIIYKQIIQNEYDKYLIIGNQYGIKTYNIIHGNNYGEINSTHTTDHKITIYSISLFTLQHEQTTKYIDGLIKNT